MLVNVQTALAHPACLPKGSVRPLKPILRMLVLVVSHGGVSFCSVIDLALLMHDGMSVWDESGWGWDVWDV